LKSFSTSTKSLIDLEKVFFIVLLFSIIAIYLYKEFMPDDAFIHIGYAKDIYEGKGYSFAGNKTYGSTSPLWPPLVAMVMFTHINVEYGARLLSFIFSIASIFLMFYVAHLRFTSTASLSAACLLCFNSYFIRWSLTGMEASAACFFIILLTCILFLENQGHVRKFWYLVVGLSPLIRPEFLIFLLIFFLYLILTQTASEYVTKILFMLIPMGAWNFYAFLYFGTIVPTTFSIKAGDKIFSTEWVTVMRTVKLLISGNPIEFCVILVTLVLLIMDFKQPLKKIGRHILLSNFIVVIAWIVFFYLYYTIKNVTIISRYSLVLLPTIILTTIFLFMKTCEQYKFSHVATNRLLVGITAVAILAHGIFTVLIAKPDADSFIQGFQQEYKKIASILSVEGQGKGAVALTDVGIIGLYSGLKIYDFIGLVDKDRLRFPNNKSYFMDKKPDFIISHGEINVDELKDSSTSFREIYSAPIAGFGINHKDSVIVKVYKVYWHQYPHSF
jgi:hypothetical protein